MDPNPIQAEPTEPLLDYTGKPVEWLHGIIGKTDMFAEPTRTKVIAAARAALAKHRGP